MSIINPVFSLISIILVASLYFVLMRRKLTSPFGDVRSGMFTAVAEWGAKQVKMIQGTHDDAGLGRRNRVNLWIPDMGPHWELEMEFVNLSLHPGWR